MINDCSTCPIKTECNECDREMTCEEFVKYWNENTGRDKIQGRR